MRGSIHTVLAAFLVLVAIVPSPSSGEEPTLLEAVKNGRPLLSFRYRYEDVADDQVGDKHARASTLRTILGYRTQAWRGWSFLVEAEDVTVLGEELYNNAGAGSLDNGVRDRPVVADPDSTEINQIYLQWENGETRLRLGRAEILLGDHRFVGNVGWRQNHQSFDAFTLTNGSLERVTFTYGYVDNVNRINGGNQEMASHLLNAVIDVGKPGKLTLYSYLLNFEQLADFGRSTASYGAEFTGQRAVSDSLTLLYELELADQSDFQDNPRNIDAGYLHAQLGISLERFTARLGFEVLEGSDRDGQFSTPLATLHKFNGWADKFLATPTDGLEDLYLQLSGKLGKIDWTVVYHDFGASEGGADYGDELDLQLLYKTPWNQTLGLKGALYNADDFAADTDKWMLWTAFAI
jgi:hypothetical protein